tara:strand:- start:207 stop:482 length:276 start_codon:yes stop_codon:yes gene_type:complete
MASNHGKRVYIQVLLDPNRGALFLLEAKEKGVKPSSLMREIIYDHIAGENDFNTYEQALIQDKQEWQNSVEARIAGRAIKRRERAGLTEEP